MITTTPPIPLEQHEASFLEALKIKHASPATIESRKDSLGLFAKYLTAQNVADVREITRQTVADYQHWLLAEEYAISTAIIHMQALRRFCEHMEHTDVILINPCAGVLLPKAGRRLPKVILTESEARTLLDAPNTQTKTGIRDKAILETFYSTGIRLAEMTKLTIHDIDYKNGFVRVTKGKGSKDRMVPLGGKACEYVHEYLTKVRAEWSQSNRDERALLPAAQIMNRACDELLAGPRLTGDQHGSVQFGHAPDQTVDHLGPCAGADQLVAAAGNRGLARMFQFPPQHGEFIGAAHDNLELRQDRRLPNVVVNAALNQVQRCCPAVLIRHHHHGYAAIPYFVEELKLLLDRGRTVIQVQYENIAPLLRDDLLDRLPAAFVEQRELLA